MILRPAEPGDKPASQEFRCAGSGEPHAIRLEWWIRRKANSWGCHADVRHHLQYLFDGDDLIGMYGWEHGLRVGWWFVKFVAVDNLYMGHRIGRGLLASCIAEIAEFDPDGVVYWNVDRANAASIAISDAVGAERDPVDHGGRIVQYVITL